GGRDAPAGFPGVGSGIFNRSGQTARIERQLAQRVQGPPASERAAVLEQRPTDGSVVVLADEPDRWITRQLRPIVERVREIAGRAGGGQKAQAVPLAKGGGLPGAGGAGGKSGRGYSPQKARCRGAERGCARRSPRRGRRCRIWRLPHREG